MENTLKLNRRKAISCIKRLSDNLKTIRERPISVSLRTDLPVGKALIKNFENNKSYIEIGIENLSQNPKTPFAQVKNLQFTRTIVALYHEYGHYLQNYSSNKHVPSMISEVSVAYNLTHYQAAWKELPHEINAENTGVKLAWNAMKHIFPEKADDYMLEYVNFRTENTTYMIPAKQGGYQSYEEVMDAFETAMDKSLNQPRTPQGRFLRYEDESIQLLMQGYDNYLRSPNAYHADKLIDTMPGAQKDRMLAALILQLHPDILEERPLVKQENLTVEHEFGRPLKIKTLPGRQISKQIDDELARAMDTYPGTTTVSNDFELY